MNNWLKYGQSKFTGLTDLSNFPSSYTVVGNIFSTRPLKNTEISKRNPSTGNRHACEDLARLSSQIYLRVARGIACPGKKGKEFDF